MALTAFDFTKGVDFSALASATGSDHNNLIDAGTPRSDSATEGKGLVIWTVDSALGVPVVPDAATTTKWKRYAWMRIPYPAATSKTPIIYGWNDDQTSIATYLKWRAVIADLTDIEADIATLQSEMNAVELTASLANAAAVAAQTLSNTAYNLAIDAQTDATIALALIAAGPAAGSITAAMLAASLDLSDKIINLPDGSITAADLVTNLDLSTKNLTLPPTTIQNGVIAMQLTSESLAIPTSANGISFNHNLGAAPRRWRWVFVCTTIDNGFAVGDEVPIEMCGDNAYPLIMAYSDANNCYARRQVGSTSINLLNPTTGAAVNITEANWRLKCYVN